MRFVRRVLTLRSVSGLRFTLVTLFLLIATVWSGCSDDSGLRVYRDAETLEVIDDAGGEEPEFDGGVITGCNPVTSASCGEGEACVVSSTQSTQCEPAGPVGVGGRCSGAFGSRCAAGLACVEPDASGSCCLPYCQTASDCGVDSACTVFGTVGEVPIGYCEGTCE